MLALIQRKVYVSKNSVPVADADNSSKADDETDGSSDKDDVDYDFDFLLDDENEGNTTDSAIDYESYDEIESSMQRGYVCAAALLLRCYYTHSFLILVDLP
jgi:hypothetical protein